ncbi:MAG: galactokinase [Chloroflexota bacterium]
MNPTAEAVISAFEKQYGSQPPILVRAPGRVNLIGEHTDYNDGFVLPMAINHAVWIALRPIAERCVQLHSLDIDETISFSSNLQLEPGKSWADYIKGTTWALGQQGYSLQGWEGVMAGDVPIGAGLSSSAAVEMAVARAFASVSDWKWEPIRMAQACQQADRNWVGIHSGIMDHMVSAAARSGNALKLDCRSLVMEHIPLPPGLLVAVLDTSTRRKLVDSAYDQRVKECLIAARFFGMTSLRDVDIMIFNQRPEELDEKLTRRARHVITENQRVHQAVDAMQNNRLVELGQILNASHASLRDDYEVSCPALNQIVECALRVPGCLGARMTGAGFGGCAVALLRADEASEFSTMVIETYYQKSGLTASVHICTAEAGASQV